METARKFFRLPASEQLALLAAFFWVSFVRLGLWLLPFSALESLLPSRVKTRKSPAITREKLLWSIRVASRYVPRASCLTQAIAARTLLARSGFPSALRFGVAKDGNRFLAHAWLECDGAVVLGDAGPECYTALPALESENA